MKALGEPSTYRANPRSAKEMVDQNMAFMGATGDDRMRKVVSGVTKRLYRVEPKDLEVGDSGAWLQKHLTPKQWDTMMSERGRLFGDNLESLEKYGHGAPDKTTYMVDVPEELASSFARPHHADDITEYLLPKEYVAKKQPFPPNVSDIMRRKGKGK